MRRDGAFAAAACSFWALGAAWADGTTVFNEIQYHPREDSAAEWVELHNQLAVDMDLSGWRLDGGISFEFPEGTVITAGGYLIVASDPTKIPGQADLGPFEGRLDNAGERLELRNNSGRLMDAVEYGDDEPWPAGADGSGASLAKRIAGTASGPAKSWGVSAASGGTPAQANAVPASPPSGLALTEIAAADADGDFWVEIGNLGGIAVDASAYRISFPAADQETDVALPAGLLEPGALQTVSLSPSEYRPEEGDIVVLASADGTVILDTCRITGRPKGRSLEHGHAWRTCSEPTPGETNTFVFHDEIVINEILYRGYPLAASPGTPAEYETQSLVPLRHTWRFEASGSLSGHEWRGTDFDDSSWNTSAGPFRGGNAVIPESGGSSVTLGRTSYYFRATFDRGLAGEGEELQLRFFADDGAVFYLIGEEVHRFNMRPGDVGPSTLAASAITEIAWSDTLHFPADALNPGTNVLAVEVHQSSFLEFDLAFGAELLLARQVSPGADAVPFRESSEEWIELFNRSGAPVDLSGWALDQAVRFEFPQGTVLGAQDYLVITRDRAGLMALYPSLANVYGDWDGRLSDGGERIVLIDGDGNAADEVEYGDGRPWPEYADGGGSSLELQDARADNDRPEAWAASDAASFTQWQNISYRAVSQQVFGPTRWNELCLGLLTEGDVLIDDIRLIEDPDGTRRNLIQNGTFGGNLFEPDGSADHWRFLGTHRLSSVAKDPDDAANPVLHIAASGPTDTRHNHIETTHEANRRLTDGNEYEVSFRARWMGGSNRLNVRSYFNRLARTVILDVPAWTGTPGRLNSRLEENVGPTFLGMRHAPILPSASDAVRVTVQAADPDGIASLKLRYAVNGGSIFAGGSGVLEMQPDGNGRYAVELPPRAAASIVEFYLEATDGRGAVSWHPAGGPESRALYQVDDGARTSLPVHRLRVIMTKKDSDFLLAEPNLMSNERLGCTVIYNDEEIFYDAAVRLKGSGAGRARDGTSYQSLNVEFPADQPFRGVYDTLGLDRSGRTPRARGQDEIYVKHLFNRAGLPCMYDDLVYLAGPKSSFNGMALLLMARYESEFTSTQFDGGEDGTVYNYDITYEPTSTVDGNPESLKRPSPFEHLQTDLTDLGDDPENYRGPLEIRTGRVRDDYAAVIRFCKTMALPADQLASRIGDVMDVDQWMRCAALTSLCGIGDSYMNGGLRHNFRIYAPAEAGRVVALPWDMDFVFNNSASSPLIQASGNLRRVIDIPANQRLYYGHVHDLLETTFNVDYLRPWLEHYGRVAGQSFTAQATYVQQRSDSARGQLERAVPDRPFEITTQGGQDFTVSTPTVVLRGRGWIDIRSIRLAGHEADLPVEWTSLDAWETTIPLAMGPNALVIEAWDFQGRLLDSKSLTITSTASQPTPARFLRITEIHYHPAAPAAGEAGAAFEDEEFEFIELRNVGVETMQLEGVSFTSGIGFEFPVGSVLEGGAYVVLVKNPEAFAARYEAGVPTLGTYSGNLSNAGEQITLRDAAGATIHVFTYQDWWELATDGGGYSLTVRDEGVPVDQWSNAAQWKASGRTHGTPGGPDEDPGGDYTAWASEEFTPEELADPEISGPLAAPSGYVVSNLLRYAFGAASPQDLAGALPEVISQNGERRIRFRRRIGAADLVFGIEVSNNLSEWDRLETTLEVEQSAGGGLEWVTASFQEGDARSRYVRIQVVLRGTVE